MKSNLPLLYCFILILSYCQTLHSAPSNMESHIDYVPKYRNQNKNFILAKIEYTADEMILHFRYVASREEESLRFSGSLTPSAWRLYTSARNTTAFTKYATLQNIKINGELKSEIIAANDESQFVAKYGEIVSGEAHFSKLPGNIRAINFEGGGIALCNDILIKDDKSPMLGTVSQMTGNVDRFYNMLSNFGVNVIRKKETIAEPKNLSLTNATNSKTEQEKEAVKMLKAAEPVNYIPKQLTSAKDMGCNTRVILKNVYFGDNSANYAGRVEAMSTIQIIVDYMNYYPESTIILHGHTDVHGIAEKNMELSRKRVLTVRNTLVTKGIDADRIKMMHHGSTQPLPGYSKGSRKNRRVEVEAFCKDS
ncbi:OmpA family protein [Aureispira anguillae]|uniref:OmpA family protein n=1 Tax=Aureispira anguillae TaxID=2864201 RepID=A0A915YDH1_9BACT|nr:OmpA family protein [Aureispira anguillae]BDS11093.1 OmpA family protein [Aureispira anguillae]